MKFSMELFYRKTTFFWCDVLYTSLKWRWGGRDQRRNRNDLVPFWINIKHYAKIIGFHHGILFWRLSELIQFRQIDVMHIILSSRMSLLLTHVTENLLNFTNYKLKMMTMTWKRAREHTVHERWMWMANSVNKFW